MVFYIHVNTEAELPQKSQIFLFHVFHILHPDSFPWLPLPASFPHLKIIVGAAANVLHDNCFCGLLKILTIFRSGKIKSLRSLGISLCKTLFNLPVLSSLSLFRSCERCPLLFSPFWQVLSWSSVLLFHLVPNNVSNFSLAVFPKNNRYSLSLQGIICPLALMF